MSTLTDRLDGLLFFPVTPFSADRGRVDLDAFAAHLESRLALLDPERPGLSAVFAACGTGEFSALELREYADVLRVAVQVTAGRVPVFGGVGYGSALAASFTAGAEQAGVDGLLVLPPYLVAGSQQGLLDHYRTIAARTDLDLIVYQRDNVTFAPETVADLAEVPNIIGFKDGKGDLDLMQRIVSAVRMRHGADRLLFLNGLPTAELTQLAYRGIGVPLYSSAVFCFAPDIALAFYHALRDGDGALADALIDRFYKPLVELRNKGVGYAVSLVKSAVRLDGLDAGPVRAPLTEPEPDHLAQLEKLIADGRAVLAEHKVGGTA
ncbi:5-dehydro-4-deoxyglucarate dehydratase [Catenulispora sp. MAP12-49]|uniref:5-dehydro-4-deoxyglucarate dehydratase n=1 Tax=Catenulispora sp. MAP12-49 TaxID=3156302 RepID=UPI003518EE39